MKKILEKIKEYNTIIIHGHIRPDGDSIGSQYGLKYLIEDNFPSKLVYVTGTHSDYLSFIGKPSMIDDNIFNGALSICVDCPKSSRLSDDRYKKSDYSIKIDHHYDSDNYTDYEYVDYKASSCTSIITEFYLENKDELMLSKRTAEALYVGLLTDTGYFKNLNVDSKTFMIASVLVGTGIDLGYINNSLSLESENILRFKGYCLENFKVSKNGFAYLVIKKEDLEKFNISEESASSLVTLISNIKTSPIWALFLESNSNIRVRLRSRSIPINDLAKLYNGGGHKFASGATLNSWDELDDFIKSVDCLLESEDVL